MMYSEFVAGTGCRENEHNYEVFKNLEIMYMNSDMSKEQIYEYGKKLVDNSKSEEQLRFEQEIKDEIKALKEQIKDNRAKAKYYEQDARQMKAWGHDFLAQTSKAWAKGYREENRQLKWKMNELKWVLEA